jgi:hypothetical protein
MVTARAARWWRASMKDHETSWRFAALAACLYLAFLVWMQVHHEMWRDEVHAWSLARNAHDFADLVTGDRRYEGHPPLWFWYLRVWGWIFPEAWGLQVATVAAAMGAAVLMLRYAPFPRYLKLMLLATYFFGYEYTVMCRNYVLGWLVLCLFCTAYHPLRPRPLTLALLLALLSWTSLYGCLIAGGLALFLVLHNMRWRAGLEPRQLIVAVGTRRIAAVLLVVAAFGFCLWSIEPFDPNPYVGEWNFLELDWPTVPQAMNRVLDGMAPLRPFTIDFWGRLWEFWNRVPAVMPYAGGVILLAAVAVLYRCWRVTAFYLATVLVMGFIQAVRYWGSSRHWGHFFMALLAASWLLRTRMPRRLHAPSLILLTVLCGFQFESFLAATVIDTREVFSGGRDAAAFIRGAGLQDLPQVGGPSIYLTPFTYLRRPFYNMENEEVEETLAFHGRRGPFTMEGLVAKAVAVSREHHSPVVVVNWMDPLPPAPPGVRMRLLFTTRPGVVEEQFTVYLLDAS